GKEEDARSPQQRFPAALEDGGGLDGREPHAVGYLTAALRIAFLRVSHFAVREFVANAAVEIGALGEGRAKRAGDILRNFRIDVLAAGRELDPQLALRLVVDEAADHVGRHGAPTFGTDG